MRGPFSLMAPAALAAVVLVLATGCGSSSDNTSSASDRTQWANDACGAFVTWQSDLKSVGNQFKNGQNLSKSSLQSAAGQVESATETLVDSLKGLGKPPSPGADEAKDTVDELGTELSDGADKIKSETEDVSGAQGVVTAVSGVTGTVSNMAGEINSTLTKLQSIDSKGDWKQAFSSAQSCKTLKGS